MDSSGPCRSVLDLLPAGIMVLSAEGAVVHMNPAALASVEAGSLDQMRNKPFLPVIAPEFRSSFLALFQKVVHFLGKIAIVHFGNFNSGESFSP